MRVLRVGGEDPLVDVVDERSAKVLYSSDAWGPAELHYLGARLWRDGLASVFGRWVSADEWSQADAIRIAEMMCSANARRVYGLH
ncbi:MAG TPA: hypothetical protein VKB75_04430 [Jatrophihabitans sp.]|nr:hypothetical protein [Jatrophihabitans sp.]